MNNLKEPLPITKMKISKERWLNKKIKYEKNLTIKDILEDMNDKTYEWLTDKDDLSIVCDPDSFKNDFINLINEKCWINNLKNKNSVFIHTYEKTFFDRGRYDEFFTKTFFLKDLKDYFLAANGYISYGGKFRVDEFNVYHEIETSLLPQWINTTLIRSHKFNENNDTLTLSAEQDGFVDQLIWKLKG